MQVRLLAVFGLSLALAACGNDDGKTNTDAGPATDGGSNCTTIAANYTAIHAEIFNTPKCNAAGGCHGPGTGGAQAQGNLLLATDKASAHAALMEDTFHPTGAMTWAKRTVANKVDDSWLWIRLTVNDPAYGRMPPAPPALNKCELDAVEGWINNGAPND